MENQITEAEARLALGSITHRQHQVLAEIDVPPLYWWSVATGWVALGVIADLHVAWAAAASTLAFGAIHSAIAPRYISGRRPTRQLSIRAEVVSRHVSVLVLAFLMFMAAVTVGLAFAAQADGAGHAATVASLFVAVMVLLGGPNLMAAIRRRAGKQIIDL
jgi:hypothetical protein